MNTIRTMGVFPFQRRDRLIDLFGYTTKGIPGVDIIGPGKNGKVMREKFIFLSRSLHLRLPLKRFVLCMEENPLIKEAEAHEIKWLELPLLILFWTLAEQLEFGKLEDCLSCGHISVSGKITTRTPGALFRGDNFSTPLDIEELEGLKFIGQSLPGELESTYHWLPLREVLSTVPGLSFGSEISSISSEKQGMVF